MRRILSHLLAFSVGVAIGCGMVGLNVAGRLSSNDRRWSDHFVAGLIDRIRIIREIRSGNGAALADRLARTIPDYVWEIEESSLDSIWRPVAFRVAKTFL